MSIQIHLDVQGARELEQSFKKAPDIVRQHMNKALEASLYEIEKNAVDSNFEFKTPRERRTGYLQRSFKFGMKMGDMEASIEPTANYAPKVHKNNPFMERIAKASESKIQRHINDAVQRITRDLIK